MESGSAVTARFNVLKSIFGLGLSQCNDFGTWSCSSASIAFRRPARPEVGSVWPIFDLIDPMGNGRVRRWPSAAPSASASMGSPTWVPVPWAST